MAGLRPDVESKVTRTGYPGSYNFDGSRFGDKRESGSPSSHPALWDIAVARDESVIESDNPVKIGEFRSNSTVGYTGFVPGKISENVVQKPHTQSNLHAAKLRPYEAAPAGQRKGYDTLHDRPSGRKSMTTILATTDMIHSNAYSCKLEGIPATISLVKDHDVPSPRHKSFSQVGYETPGYAGFVPDHLKPVPEQVTLRDSEIGRAIVGYSGFIPGRTAETVFGATATRSVAKAMKTREYLANKKSEAPAMQYI